MRRIIIINIILLCIECYAYAQNNVPLRNIIKTETIYVAFDKTTHIVFPSDVATVDYIDENLINAEKIKNVPYIVRVQANSEEFSDTTNLTIVCHNGDVYTFDVVYLPENKDYFFVVYANNNIYRENYTININNLNIVNMFFPANVIYCYHGNEEVLMCEYSNNMVKLGTLFDSIPESNLFVVDADGGLYEITVENGTSESYTYNFDNERKYTALLDVNSVEMERLISKIRRTRRNIYSVGSIKNKMEMSLANLYVYRDYLFFSFDIKNSANIDYDIDFIKCFIRDKKLSKNSTIQEILQDPVYSEDFTNKIRGHTKNRFVVVFKKFTIPDDKILLVEMYERGGGRHMTIEIENSYLLNTQLLKGDTN